MRIILFFGFFSFVTEGKKEPPVVSCILQRFVARVQFPLLLFVQEHLRFF